MTLHAAIEKLLREAGRPMTTTEIAHELNKNKWYEKGNKSAITPYQIHGRTKNYPQIFFRSGSTVTLMGNSIDFKPDRIKSKTVKTTTNDSVILVKRNSSDIESILMNESKFVLAADVDSKVSDHPGIYCVKIRDSRKLPSPFNQIITERGHNIIYIGIATKSLLARFLNQELRARGHGTFFRSIGAMLGYRPLKGSLIHKSNKRDFKFAPSDEAKTINWINENLLVNWVNFDGDFETVESYLIEKYLPLVNLAKNPAGLSILTELRAECVRIANSQQRKTLNYA